MKVTVQSGQTLKSMLRDRGVPARKLDAAVKQIVKANNLDSASDISAGAVLTFPDELELGDRTVKLKKLVGDVASRADADRPEPSGGRPMGALGIHAFDDIGRGRDRSGCGYVGCGYTLSRAVSGCSFSSGCAYTGCSVAPADDYAGCGYVGCGYTPSRAVSGCSFSSGCAYTGCSVAPADDYAGCGYVGCGYIGCGYIGGSFAPERATADERGTPFLDLKPSFRNFALRVVGPAALDQVAGVPVDSAKVKRFNRAHNTVLDPVALQTVDVRFGRVDQASFDRLHKAFGGRSEVAYDPDRRYQLIDFLPPAVQALLNRDIELPASQNIPGSRGWESLPHDEEKSIGVSVNCHSTAYEAARAFRGQARDEVSIFVGDMTLMEGLTASDRFKPVASLSADQNDQLDTLKLKPGDVVQCFKPGQDFDGLLHSAVYVGGGLYFEKPDTESSDQDSPFRLATSEMMLTPVRAFLGEDPEVKVFRPRRKLPQAMKIFGGESVVSADVKAWEERRGQPLGLELISLRELSIGGGTLGAYVEAIAPVAIEIGANGRGQIADD